MEHFSAQRAEAEVRLLGQCATNELAVEVTESQVGGELVRCALQMRTQQIAAHAPRRRELCVVLVRGVVQQPLVRRTQSKQPQRVRPAERNPEFPTGVVALAAVVRQHRRPLMPRIERIGWRGSVHRIRIEAAFRVEHRQQPGAAWQRTVDRHDRAVETEVRLAWERPVGLVRGPPGPVVAPILRHHVDQSGDGLAVARGKAVGGQRGLGEDVRRNSHAQRARGCVELILDAQPIEHERLLAETAAAITLAHRTRRQRDRFLERRHRKAPQLFAADPLHRGDERRIENRIGVGFDDNGLVDRVHVDQEIHDGGLAGTDEHAVAPRRLEPDRPGRNEMPAAADLANAIEPGAVRARDKAAVQTDIGPGDRHVAVALPYVSRNRAARLRGRGSRESRGNRDEREQQQR